jgi:hypothetical protein
MRIAPMAVLAAGLVAVAACDTEEPTATAPETVAAFAKGGSQASFRTSQPAQAELLVGGDLVALATSGDVMPGSGERLVGIPDGIGSFGNGRFMSSFLNHEISGAARVSLFNIDTRNGTIVTHSYPIDGSEGYNRLCSASWNDADDGFPGGAFFTGEESSDGVQLALDRQGRVTELPHIGYYAHEQQIAVPGFENQIVVVNFDDDGTSGGDLTTEDAESEFYMYVARNSNGVLRGTGQLYVFASSEAENVGDMSPGDVIIGHWVPVPEAVALQKSGPGGKPLLDTWVDEPGREVFDFTRLEDGFYDKVSAAERGNPAVYIYDTGDPTLGNPADGFWDKWGSIYRMEWQDPRDAAGPTTLTLLARSAGPTTGWASPDNGDMNADGVIMLQEDPAAGPWGRDETKVFAFQRAADGSLVDVAGTEVISTVGSGCNGGGINGACWETSGIEDVSRWFGPNSWIFDVQSKAARPDCPECVTDGQLLLARIGGEFGFN